tara:strand:- start:3802 stop:5865 length:2064 start_codon:yes stop_codon:yes gene_type:complete
MQSDYTQAFLPLATMELRIGAESDRADSSSDYRRVLDLSDAVHSVTSGSVTQSTVVSHPHGVLMHVIEGLPAAARVEVVLSSPLSVLENDNSTLLVRLPSDVAPGHESDFAPISWSSDPGASLEGAVIARIVTEKTDAGASRTVVFVATGTTYRGPQLPPEGTAADVAASISSRLDAAIAAGSDRVRADHCADYRSFFDRVSLELGAHDTATPSDVRVSTAAESVDGPLAVDPSLAALLFDYGRYLLISSSRPGGLPATLQGIWNDSLQPPWSSNYTTNINMQMNYWSSDVANLPEMAEPLVDFIEALSEAGRETAHRLYGARGWVTHHNSDAWAFTSPVGAGHGDTSWAFWPMGGLWLVRHLTERLNFGDSEFAARAWPIIRGAAEFALDWMVQRPDGVWVTTPSSSPENQFSTASGVPASLSESSTMDLSLLRELFETVLATAAQLDLTHDAVVREATERITVLPELPPLSGRGGIREWSDDAPAVDPHHRHLSLLYALYPGTAAFTDEHRRAAEQTLEERGDDSTGWSVAWKIALWARLGREDKVSDLLRLQFRPATTASGPFAGGLYPNLFAAHPPFQIDGNLGYVAALAETLVQSHAGYVELLPALPAELANGRVRGLIARPGLVVDIEWVDSQLVHASLRAHGSTQNVIVRYRGRDVIRAVDSISGTQLSSSDFNESDTAP